MTGYCIIILLLFGIVGTFAQSTGLKNTTTAAEEEEDDDDDETTTKATLQTRNSTHFDTCMSNCSISRSHTFRILYPEIVNCKVKQPKLTPYCSSKLNLSSLFFNPTIKGATHILNNNKLSWYGANKYCRSRGLELVSTPDLRQKLKDLSSFVQSEGSKWSKGATFWLGLYRPAITSVTGSGYDEYLENMGSKSCFYANVTQPKTTLDEGPCFERRGVVCDVPTRCFSALCFTGVFWPAITNNMCKKELCPKKIAVPKSDIDKQLEVAHKFGIWKKGCNNTFLFGTQQRTLKEAYMICAKFGMNLLAVETLQELDCLRDIMVKDKQNFPNNSYLTLFTSGFDDKCDGKYRWCSTAKEFTEKVPLSAGEHREAYGGLCIVVIYVNGRIALNVGSCVHKYFHICEGTDNTPIISVKNDTAPIKFELDPLVIDKKAGLPACPNPCENKTMIYNMEGKRKLVLPEVIIEKSCGQYIAFVNKSYTGMEAHKVCCDMGMKLVTVDTYEKLACLENIFRGNFERVHYFHTSGRLVKGQFTWCSNGQPFTDSVPWFTNITDIYLGGLSIHCTIFYAVYSGTCAVCTTICNFKLPVICERDAPADN